MSLPQSLDELRGLRAARWIRESTRSQVDNFGPDAQRERQDTAIRQYGLIDSGIGWLVAHSGRTIVKAPEWAEMQRRAGVDYDVLLLGYVNRFARSMEAFIDAKRVIHASGAVLLFCSENVLSSDPETWERWAREMVEAEAYSRRLGTYIRDGYHAKFTRQRDQGGSAPLGFARTGPKHTLEVDPDTIGTAIDVFERYATGTRSQAQVAEETGLRPSAVRAMLANPVYNGRAQRHRRSRATETIDAAWRGAPPVPDALWARVQEVRSQRWTGGGGTPVRTYLLAKRMWCVCGHSIKADVAHPKGYTYRRYRHADTCERWTQGSYAAEVFEAPIAHQVSSIRLDAHALTRLRSRSVVVTPIRKRLLERELAERAQAHASRKLTTQAYLAEHERITGELDALVSEPAVDADTAIAWLRNVRRTWRAAGAEARKALVAALYSRITVENDRIVEVELTPDAYRHGLDQVMSEYLAEARPARAGNPPAIYRCTIIGKSERRRKVASC